MVTSMETSNFSLAALCYILTPLSLCGIFGRLLVLKILVITGCCFPQSYKVKPSETWPIGPTVFCRTRQSQAGCSLTIALLSYLYSSEQGSSLSQVRELEKFRRRGRSEKWAESYICTQVHRAPIAFSPLSSRTCSRRITTVIIFASMLFLVLFKSKVVTSTASHTVIYGYLEFVNV